MSIESSPQPSSESEKYVISDEDHELAKKFQPEYLARGGEHLVYRIPDHPQVVAKVAIEPLKKLLTRNVEENQTTDYLSLEDKQKAEQLLESEAQRFSQFRQYFGKDHTLAQKKYLMKVPVTPRLLEEIYKGSPPATPAEAYSMVVIQNTSEALNAEEQVSIISGEMEEANKTAYRQQTEDLLVQPYQNTFNREQFLQVQATDSMQTILNQCDTDPSFREQLTDFIQRSIQYTSETNEILDLAGGNNTVFYHQNEKWNYELIDALYPFGAEIINRVKSALEKINQNQEPEDFEKNDLQNAVQYIRTINGLASFLELENRIDIIPENVDKEKILSYLESNR